MPILRAHSGDLGILDLLVLSTVRYLAHSLKADLRPEWFASPELLCWAVDSARASRGDEWDDQDVILALGLLADFLAPDDPWLREVLPSVAKSCPEGVPLLEYLTETVAALRLPVAVP